ncbi:hypothetical protein EMPS_04293 [Entomortierella parvispora]|uniref:Pentacotripeptide-repeat region of PRORP domain-containing protein n=1 Tax=Entomortierella parvispora TaxID=205924 RepID=A0A9P3LV93_9FUNG|nr:hypothetical protein EMPS_04293 [Entomortierella parvispora]
MPHAATLCSIAHVHARSSIKAGPTLACPSLSSTSLATSTTITKQIGRSLPHGSCRNIPHHRHHRQSHYQAFSGTHNTSTRHHPRSSYVGSSHPSYDPQLAAYMDRWVRVVFSGHRRMHSSLAKPIPTSVSTSYTVIDIPTQQIPLDCEGSTTLDPLPTDRRGGSTVTSNDKEGGSMSLSEFRQCLDALPVDDHGLVFEFRSLKKRKPNQQPKPYMSKQDQEKIDQYWQEYLAIAEQDRMEREAGIAREDGNQLSRSDYTRLMQIVRYGQHPKEAMHRILVLKDAMDKRGFRLTRKMGEIVARTYLNLGSIEKSIQIHDCIVERVGRGSWEHKKLLWAMVDGFAVNRFFQQGVTFLDSHVVESDQDRDLYLALHRRLLAYRLDTSSPSAFSQSRLNALHVFYNRKFPLRLSDLTQALEVINSQTEKVESLLDFSTTSAGTLVKSGNSALLTPLLVSLLRAYQLPEAARVRSLMLQQNVPLDRDAIRLEFLRSLESCPEREERIGVMEQWDRMTSDNPLSLDVEYSALLRSRFYELDLSGALAAAQYMAEQDLAAHKMDFRNLNSHIINFGSPKEFPLYLQIRYTLPKVAGPNLRTYRRLVYAACRRSDLHSAMDLFKLIRIRHQSWTLDTPFYNAIISTAAAIGHINVAEKMFRCLLESGLEPDHYSFEGLLNGYGQVGDLEAALMIPEQMIKRKLSPTTKTFNLVMKAYLGARRDLSTSRKLLKVMQLSQGSVAPDLVTFNQLLEGYRRVANTTWFDDYFDQFFGERSRCRRERQRLIGIVGSDKSLVKVDKETARLIWQRKRDAGLLGPEKTDDWTLLIQLKHSLSLPSVDLTTVQELWQAIEPKLEGLPCSSSPSPSPSPSFAEDTASRDLEKGTSKIESPLPATYVPFKRRLGRETFLPATDQELFRFTTLSLFRDAFHSRGHPRGVKHIDRLLRKHFPTHPEVMARSNSRPSAPKLRVDTLS